MKYIIFTVLFFIASQSNILYAQVFTATPNQVLAQGTTISFVQNVSGLPTTSNDSYGFYQVTINLTHPLTSDVRLFLQSPSGTFVTLAKNNGNGANFTNTKFKRYADSSILYSNSPYSSTYMCYDNNFAEFTNGQDPNGAWTLFYEDNVLNSFSGTLQSWSLHFIANPTNTSITNANSNLPIFKINTSIGYVPSDPKTQGTLQIINNTNLVNSFNATATPTTILNLGIETQGYTSSGGDKPNYDIELHNATGIYDTNYALLGLAPESDFILKAAVTDDWLMKDALTFEMSNKIKYYAPHTRYIELLINNEYKGVYIVEEKVKRDSNRVHIKKLASSSNAAPLITGGYIIEINPNSDPAAWYSQYPGYQGPNLTSSYEFKLVYPKQDSITPMQLNYIHNYTDSFETALHGSGFQNPVSGWRKYAHEKSFIDFLIVSEYSSNYDTYGRSTYLYKENITDGNKLKIGPPWDADRGFVADTGWVHIITHGYWIFPFWWQQLRQDSLFNKRLACRYNTMRKKELSDTSFTNFIDKTDALIRTALQRNTNRWQNYVAPVSELKTWCTNRLAWMDAHLSPVVFPPNPLTSTTFCVGTTINIFQGNQYSYNFIPGPDTSSFVPTTSGNYIASISSAYGCETQQPFTVITQPTPNMIGNTVVCANTNSLYKINSSTGSSYAWTINGGSVINGCGPLDTSCIVHWNNAGTGQIQVNQQIGTCSGSASKSVTISECTSTHNTLANTGIEIYPNPIKDVVNIRTNKYIKKVKIIALNGVVLLETKELFVDLSCLDSGFYFIQITDMDNTIYNAKIVKE